MLLKALKNKVKEAAYILKVFLYAVFSSNVGHQMGHFLKAKVALVLCMQMKKSAENQSMIKMHFFSCLIFVFFMFLLIVQLTRCLASVVQCRPSAVSGHRTLHSTLPTSLYKKKIIKKNSVIEKKIIAVVIVSIFKKSTCALESRNEERSDGVCCVVVMCCSVVLLQYCVVVLCCSAVLQCCVVVLCCSVVVLQCCSVEVLQCSSVAVLQQSVQCWINVMLVHDIPPPARDQNGNGSDTLHYGLTGDGCKRSRNNFFLFLSIFFHLDFIYIFWGGDC